MALSYLRRTVALLLPLGALLIQLLKVTISSDKILLSSTGKIVTYTTLIYTVVKIYKAIWNLIFRDSLLFAQ